MLEKTLESPLDCKRSNQSILKEISPGISLEGMMLKPKVQYFGHLTRRVDSLEKTLMLGEIVGRRRRGQPRMRWLDGIIDSMDQQKKQTLCKVTYLGVDLNHPLENIPPAAQTAGIVQPAEETFAGSLLWANTAA